MSLEIREIDRKSDQGTSFGLLAVAKGFLTQVHSGSREELAKMHTDLFNDAMKLDRPQFIQLIEKYFPIKVIDVEDEFYKD